MWAQGRIADGWRWGANRDNDNKLHPDLIPYSDLTEETKQYDRDTANETLKAIIKFGYEITVDDGEQGGGEGGNGVAASHRFGTAVAPGKTYKPQPINTSDVQLSSHIVQLGELLAANTHDVWSRNRMDQGWKYGPTRNDKQKHHNCLVPYAFLTNEVRAMAGVCVCAVRGLLCARDGESCLVEGSPLPVVLALLSRGCVCVCGGGGGGGGLFWTGCKWLVDHGVPPCHATCTGKGV